jgi:hypothetical protein
MKILAPLLATLIAPIVFTARADGVENLTASVRAADSALFTAIFDACDVGAVAAGVSEDLEFFHDQWGQIAKSRDEFVKIIAGGCQRQKEGTDFKASRRLIESTLVVYPMKGYGAVEIGEHQFFKLEADGSLTPTEFAKFTQLWREEHGKWVLARVFSYAHTKGLRPGGER